MIRLGFSTFSACHHVIQHLKHESLHISLSCPSRTELFLKWCDSDAEPRRAQSTWLTKSVGSLNFSGQLPIYVWMFLKVLPCFPKGFRTSLSCAPANHLQKHPNNTWLVFNGSDKEASITLAYPMGHTIVAGDSEWVGAVFYYLFMGRICQKSISRHPHTSTHPFATIWARIQQL